jgi:ribosomal protein L37AE/L43A
MDYEAMDKAALVGALLALYTCPRCRADLRPVPFCEDVWGCADCRETWHVPQATK